MFFVRPKTSSIFNSSITAEAARGRRKVFVVERVMGRRKASPGQAKVRRILIFDNHPESLRLVFHRRRDEVADDQISEGAKWWEVLGASFLMAAALLGMFWPLF